MYDLKTLREVERILKLKVKRLERLAENTNLSESDLDLIYAKGQGLAEIMSDIGALLSDAQFETMEYAKELIK